MAKTNHQVDTTLSASESGLVNNRKPQPETNTKQALASAIATDEYAGQGGDYVFDPATGKRTPWVPDPD